MKSERRLGTNNSDIERTVIQRTERDQKLPTRRDEKKECRTPLGDEGVDTIDDQSLDKRFGKRNLLQTVR